MTISALSSAASGLRAAASRFETSAAKISNPNAGGDTAEAMVDILQAKFEFEASAKMVRMASDLQKSAIDILA